MPTTTTTAAASETETEKRARRHRFTGVVLSDKGDKTRVVQVEWLYRHPRYDKTLRKRSKFYVHDEKNEAHTGDRVEIAGTRPLSKLKRWRLVRIIEKARIPGGGPVLKDEVSGVVAKPAKAAKEPVAKESAS
ncbi:MAG: 30S ribosomal protein S17 [Elusimicrobia bacterium]|nr:30S ribosomal protein S17 [Elusimicrobiota bacterium]